MTSRRPGAPEVRTARSAARLGHTRPVFTEARRGWWAAVVSLAVLFGLSLEFLENTGLSASSWVGTHAALRTQGLLLGGPFAVAAGCWHGGRERRRATGELFSSVPASPLRRTALAATPAVLWPAVGYALAAALRLAYAWGWQEVPYGSPFASLLVADTVAIASLGLLGFVAGRLIPWVLTAPVLATLAGVSMAYLGAGQLLAPGGLVDDDALRWLAPSNEHRQTWDEPVWWFGPASVVWFGGLALAALTAYAGRRAVAAASLAGAVAAAGVLVGTGGALWRPDPGATALTCTERSPQVCMSRVHALYLPEFSAAVSGVTSKLRRIPNAPERLVEVPTEYAGREPYFRRPVTTAHVPGRDESVLSDAPAVNYRQNLDAYTRDAAFNAAVYGCVKRPHVFESPVPKRYSDAVATWLAPSAEPSFALERSAATVLARIKAMPEHGRTAWLGDYFAAVRDCRPERIEAP